MEETGVSVPSLVIPLQDMTMVLPNTAVAEIIDYREPEPVDDAPEWLLGQLTWRGIDLPLVAFEAVVGGEKPRVDGRLRVAVLNTLYSSEQLPFYGIVLQGIPRLLRADHSTVTSAANDEDERPGILAPVEVNGMAAAIPDLQALEAMIRDLPA